MIRLALIGAGATADRHARAIAALPDACRLVGVFDPDGGSSGRLEPLLLEADAAIVASPADLRFHHSALALEHGLDLLVEQPVAPTVDNARMLDRIASLRPLQPIVMASSPGNFEPAVRELIRLLDGHPPIAAEMRRLVPVGERASGTEITRDLMLQDVELLVAIAQSPLVRLHASGGESYAVATLVFESGLIGTLHAGFGGGPPQTQILVTAESASISADRPGATVQTRRDSVTERARIPASDPYTAQLERFLRAVRERGAPSAGLRNAAANIEVIARVRECLAVQAAATGGVPAR